jgi:hypothetical protein
VLTLSLKADGPVRYDNIGDADNIGPCGFARLDNGNYEYFDPVAKVGRLFNSNLDYLRKVDYRIEAQRAYGHIYNVAYSGNRIAIGDDRQDNQMLCVYEENKGLVGYYRFEDDTNFYFAGNARIITLGNYAFYFKELGTVEWLERPCFPHPSWYEPAYPLPASLLRLEEFRLAKFFRLREAKAAAPRSGIRALFRSHEGRS